MLQTLLMIYLVSGVIVTAMLNFLRKEFPKERVWDYGKIVYAAAFLPIINTGFAAFALHVIAEKIFSDLFGIKK